MSKGNHVKANKYKTHTNGELTSADAEKEVVLSGWVHARRDHGGLIFIDLRDRWGITQLTFDPKRNEAAWKVAEGLRSEYVVTVTGKVAARPAEMVNKQIETGEIEVDVISIEILSESKALPFEIDSNQEVNEELRLKYRYLDLRNKRLQEIMKNRDSLLTHIRSYMHDREFVEVQTPILANSSPEGARDYLVPSRLHPGTFYALPQAPQQFKQLLMVAGLERYFQIAPCFRDEDPRADRHPGEFYQLDFEMSFVEQEDVFQVVEPLMIELTEKFSEKKVIHTPFPRFSWKEAMTKYGSDKPDLRFDFSITDVSDLIRGSEFSVFEKALAKGVVHALHVQGGASLSRSQIDDLTTKAKEMKAGGLAYILLKDGKLNSPIIKFLGEEKAQAVVDMIGAKDGDAIFFGADSWLTVCKSLGAVRDMLGSMFNLKDQTKAAWCWIIDYPMYEMNDETGKIDFSHNPFSMPQGGMEALETKNPLDILAYQYDIVCNGYEIASGAIRNHRPDVMYKAFGIAGYSKEDVDKKFGGMIQAFQFGAPPHGGAAPGLDRLMMVLWDLTSIRDIYAFPKNGRAQDVMMNAPSKVDEKQLRDLHITLALD